jgi:hypothetical protein
MLPNPFRYSDTPQLCRFFSSFSESRREKYSRNTNVHILTEDIHLGIMPIGGRSRNHPGFTITISGNDKSKEEANKLLNSMCSYHRHSAKELICDVVENIIKIQLYNGISLYEITKDSSGRFQLSNFTSDMLVNLFGLHFQFVPKSDRKMWDRKLIIKTSKSIWKVRMPKVLGGVSGYRKLIRRLANNTGMHPKGYNIEEVVSKSSQFDFNEYVNQTKIYLYRHLALWGGTLRHYSTDHANEYYIIYRAVKLNRAKAIMRGHVINELNTLLDRLDISAKIEISGLPTVEFIDDQLRKLEAGEVSLDHVNATTRSS